MRWACAAALAVVVSAVCACDDDGGGGLAWLPRDYASTYQRVYDCRRSVDHDLNQVAIWASPEAAAAYRDGRFPLPGGAVVLKEEFAPADEACATPIAWTVMRKGAASADAGADSWEYVQLDRSFAPVRDANLARCASCHRACAPRDFTCAE